MPEIIVCLKQIYDLGQIRIDTSSKRPITEGAARKISDFDKNALEEALRIKEKHGGRVLALIGGTKDAAKEALAMGADGLRFVLVAWSAFLIIIDNKVF